MRNTKGKNRKISFNTKQQTLDTVEREREREHILKEK